MYHFSTKPAKNVIKVELFASMPIWERLISTTIMPISARTPTAISFAITKAEPEVSAVGPMEKKNNAGSANGQFS